jgi:hypothetical protein
LRPARIHSETLTQKSKIKIGRGAVALAYNPRYLGREEIGSIKVQGQPRQKVLEIPFQPMARPCAHRLPKYGEAQTGPQLRTAQT